VGLNYTFQHTLLLVEIYLRSTKLYEATLISINRRCVEMCVREFVANTPFTSQFATNLSSESLETYENKSRRYNDDIGVCAS